MGNLHVTNLGKAYKGYPGRFARLMEWLLPFGKPKYTVKWVLQDINFTINRGESVGIIGVNGAGKSTLLKMLTGTTQPTTGCVKTTGSVAALLELGMGFHPEFTGRQNVYMGGQLLGMSIEEIRELMPQIEAFAEVGDYIDRPVRVYSSGMQMRLAFSVATARRPDILIVDEALSVGDAYFQHKCFDRIREFSARGTSLLFVSHDPGAIRNLCSRAILLNAGRIEFEGAPDDALDYYNALIASLNGSVLLNDPSVCEKNNGVRSGNGKLVIQRVRLYNQGHEIKTMMAGASLLVKIEILVNDPVGEFCVGMSIRDKFGNVVFGTNTELLNNNLYAHDQNENIVANFSLPGLAIGVGSYSVSIALHDARSHVVSNYDWWDKAVIFEVAPRINQASQGVCYMPVEFYLS